MRAPRCAQHGDPCKGGRRCARWRQDRHPGWALYAAIRTGQPVHRKEGAVRPKSGTSNSMRIRCASNLGLPSIPSGTCKLSTSLCCVTRTRFTSMEQVFVSPVLEYSMDPCYAEKKRWVNVPVCTASCTAHPASNWRHKSRGTFANTNFAFFRTFTPPYSPGSQGHFIFRVCRWKDSDGKVYDMQVAFQLRIRPGTYAIGQHTLGGRVTKPFDDTGTYTNNEVGVSSSMCTFSAGGYGKPNHSQP
jgi:hypothetical protein